MTAHHVRVDLVVMRADPDGAQLEQVPTGVRRLAEQERQIAQGVTRRLPGWSQQELSSPQPIPQSFTGTFSSLRGRQGHPGGAS